MVKANAEVFSEVYDILNHLEKEIYYKIPENLIKLIDDNRNTDYTPFIDYSININENNLQKGTREILALIYRDFVCDKEERERLIKRDELELQILEEEKKEKYNPNNIFKKEEINEKNQQEILEKNDIVVYKENFFHKIINKIKKVFHVI